MHGRLPSGCAGDGEVEPWRGGCQDRALAEAAAQRGEALRERIAHLSAVRIRGVAAGLHLMIELSRDADEAAIVAAAASREVAVYGVRVHRARPHTGPPALLLGYGAMSEMAIAAGVERLAAAVARNGEE